MWSANIVRKDALRRHVDLYVYQELSGGYLNVLTADGSVKHINVGENTDADIPGIRIPTNALPAILGALSQHLGAVEHPQSLRKDYDAERERVDVLLAAVIRRMEA